MPTSPPGDVPAGFAAVAELARGEAVDEAPIAELAAFVAARHDCADFRLLTLLHLELRFGELLSPTARDQIRRAALGFKYWWDEPGTDSMCYWSENHQIIFATVEYLAGRRWPDEVFGNASLTGRRHRAKARARLLQWLRDRCRFGFSEWLSNTYYEEDAAALALLVDVTDDPDLAELATVVLDLLMLDLATHSVRGRFAGASGRGYERAKLHPETAEVTDLVAFAFTGRPIDPGRLSATVGYSGYRVPAAIRALAEAPELSVRSGHGLDLAELARVGKTDDETTVGRFAWGMEAFTNPETIRLTMATVRRHRLLGNRFLAPLTPLVAVPGPLLPALVRLLNPVTQGMAIRGAQVHTWRSGGAQLSSAQRHHPGAFGDQQHLWQATLPGDVSVFSTHPGGPLLADGVRNATPGFWVGNGVQPDIAQIGSTLVARYDLRGRRGYREGPRAPFSHLYWPDRFQRAWAGPTWRVGQAGGVLIGVRAAGPLVTGEADELRQLGPITGWGVQLHPLLDATDPESEAAAFVARIAESRLTVDRRGMDWAVGSHRYELPAGAEFRVDGRAIPADPVRLEVPGGRVERGAPRLDLDVAGHRLRLDLRQGRRVLVDF